jgi:hypothetical protein
MELIVVMAVTLLLTGLMLPALSQVRENSHRVVCSSNLRQTGLALVMYADENWDHLPKSAYFDKKGSEGEMMAAHRGEGERDAWEGLGWLYAGPGWPRYVPCPEVFYCPSHHGEHGYDRYRELYDNPGSEPIYTNYQYAGPSDWDDEAKRMRRMHSGRFVLAADGLRTLRDFNHREGMNVLRNDNSVNWRTDITDQVIQILSAAGPSADGDAIYSHIWDLIESD